MCMCDYTTVVYYCTYIFIRARIVWFSLSSLVAHDQSMKIRKHKFLLYRLAYNILNEPLNPRHVLKDVFVRLANLALDQDGREEALADRQRFPIALSALFVHIRGRAGLASWASAGRPVGVQVVKHAQVHASTRAFVRDGHLPREHQPRHGELDGERHE